MCQLQARTADGRLCFSLLASGFAFSFPLAVDTLYRYLDERRCGAAEHRQHLIRLHTIRAQTHTQLTNYAHSVHSVIRHYWKGMNSFEIEHIIIIMDHK